MKGGGVKSMNRGQRTEVEGQEKGKIPGGQNI